ncbi:hypothetical protein EMIT0P171_110137 [Pseudomonas sp. IT-P171]
MFRLLEGGDEGGRTGLITVMSFSSFESGFGSSTLGEAKAGESTVYQLGTQTRSRLVSRSIVS